MGLRSRHLAMVAAVVLLVSCSDRTSILVRVTSPTLDVPADVSSLDFSIRGETTGTTVDRSFPITSTWPHTLSIRPGPMESASVTIGVRGMRGTTLVAEGTARATFVAGSEIVVEVVLGSAVTDAGPTPPDAGPPDVGPPDAPIDAPIDAGCSGAAACDDGVPCTIDTCETFDCVHTPDDTLCADGTTCDAVDGCPPRNCTTSPECDDGDYCNGAEVCDAAMTCQRGPLPCDDADDCTDDACDEPTDACSYTTADDDGDGFGDASCPEVGGVAATDCNDADAAVSPDAIDECDGIDNDCDATCDDTLTCCRGMPGTCVTACGTTGNRVCGAACGWGACSPPAEICNGMDDDCNGMCDDGVGCCAGATSSCTTTCGSAGTNVCTATCAPGVCTPPAETCNGLDDDCDARLDETSPCVAGVVTPCITSCGSPGTSTCGPTCMVGACTPPAEACNGTDDDCDGMIDEGCAACPSCPGAVTVFEPGGRFTHALGPHVHTGSCGGGGGSEYYLTFTLTAPSDLFATTHQAGAVDTVLYLRSCGCVTGTELACNDDADGRTTSVLRMTNLAAGTYQLFVDTKSASTATIPVDVYITPTGMASDRCGSPTRIAPGTTTLAGTTVGYSSDYTSARVGTCNFAGTGTAVERVYYFYLPTASTVSFSSCGGGTATNYDTTFYVRTSCTDGALAAQSLCDDDSCTGTETCTSTGYRSTISGMLPAGLYYFFADGYNDATPTCPAGNYSIAITGL